MLYCLSLRLRRGENKNRLSLNQNPVTSLTAFMFPASCLLPEATPTKPGKQQDKEIQNYDDEVWSKTYKLMAESLMVGDDIDNDMLALSRI